MTEREAPADIVIEIARMARLPQEKLDGYLNRLNKAVWGEIVTYREIVNEKEICDTQ